MANPALILLLLLFPVTLHAEIIDISQHSGIIRDSSGNYKTINGRGTISSINTGTQLQVQNRVPVPTSKGNQYVDISRTALVDLAKVGGALASLARKLTPLGMAAGTVAYICAETNICEIDGIWQTEGNPTLPGYPPVTNEQAYYCTGFGCTPGGTDLKSPTPSIACETFASYSPDFDYSSASETQCHLTRVSNGSDFTVNINRFPGACPANYTWNGSQCTLNGTEQRPATEQYFDNVADSLNDPVSTDHILDNGGDVPVDVSTPPTLDAPVEKTIGTENKEIKDGQGNITGTETTETTIEITDAATSQNPNHLDLSETTTVTNYDINNNITNQTTTVTETAQPAPEETPELDIQVEFDTVSDTELQEKEVEAPFDTASWGGGACPPDIEMSLSFGNHTFSSQPFCDFAISMKPIILLVASIVGAFIVVTSARPATT